MKSSELRPFSVLLTLLFLFFGPALLFAGGTPEVPDIPPISSGTQYISPNDDGVQEEATISFESTLYVKSEEGYVPEYGLEIRSESGEVVKRIVEKEKRDIGWFRSLFTGYKKFSLERSITWDGKDETGTPVADGVYSLSVWVSDPSGKRQEQQLDDFVVDTKAPDAVIVEPEYLVFSPNGDGRKDSLVIEHSQATEEEEWSGEIRNSEGEAVRGYSWSPVPQRVEWEGRNDRGDAVDNGSYSYVLQSTDLAGNSSGEIRLEGIELDRRATPVEILIEPPQFSPNGDGVKDSATVYLDQAIEDGIVGWSYRIRNIHNKLYEKASGRGDPPEEVILDGLYGEGQRYPEDGYIFSYSLRYLNGNNPSTEETFRIDVTPPELRVEIENPIFSPDGDGRKDEVRISYSSDEKVIWQGSILSQDGDIILSTDSSRTTSLIVWDGRDEKGDPVEEGSYTFTGTFTDEAGNVHEATPVAIKVDTSPVDVGVSTIEGFSPNGDGVKDTLPIRIESNQYSEVQRWTLALESESGEARRVFSGTDTLPRSIEWDGDLLMDEVGETKSASEGYYTGRLSVEYAKGKSAEDTTERFFLDVTPPRVTMKVKKNPLVKSDDKVEGEVFIGIDIVEETEVRGWSMDIINNDGEVIRSYAGEEDPSDDITWSGTPDGKEIPMGEQTYTMQIEVTDAAGNTERFSEDITLDLFLVKRDGQFHIAVPNIIFGAYQHKLDSRGQEMYERNLESIRHVAGIYDRYSGYNLLLEGHALNIYRGISENKEAQEEKVLRPLTERRAATVRDALVEEGLSEDRIRSEAYGGTEPIVSVRDRSVRWKNRRVEFIMQFPETETEEEAEE